MFAVAVVIFSFLFVHYRFLLTRSFGQATSEMLTNGTAFVPFQYRTLIPLLVHTLSQQFPSIKILTLYQIFEFAATVGLCFAFRYYLSLFLPSARMAALFTFGLFYSLPFNFLNVYWYPSDIPSVLFFTLGLIAIYRQSWRWYYPLFILATFNRETTLFLVLLYVAVYFRRTRLREFSVHLFAQIGIWLGIKVLLYQIYAGNPRQGYGLFEWQLWANIHSITLTQPESVLLFLMNWGLIWLPVLLGYSLIKHSFVRCSLLIPIVQLFVMSMVGVLAEMRIYGESTPIIVAAFALVITEMGRKRMRTSSPIVE